MAKDLIVENQPSLYSLFEVAALSHLHSIATIFDDGDVVTVSTYQDVLESSGTIAKLLKEVGWKDRCVGVYCMGTPQIPDIILGILQVPCCFVPIDPKAPYHISTHVISSVGLQMVLVQITLLKEFHDTICQQWNTEIRPVSDKLEGFGFVLIQIDHKEANKQEHSSLRCKNLAYVMHTSGTTGTPKVIRVPHKCILPNIIHLRDIFNISSYDVIFNAATLTFDTSIVEIFLALSQGASLLMVPCAVKLMPRRLMGILMRNHVTVLQSTPTLIRRFDPSLLHTQLFGASSSLRLMIFGGEPCPTPGVIHQWRDTKNTTTFYNIYGITEVSCWASLYKIPEQDIKNTDNQSVPIGDPLDDTVFEVRDDYGNKVTEGCGTVFIGGTERVCYLDNEEVSSASQLVMRNTGDLVEITNRGLVYVGRHDDQIKRHGKRITLSQIQQSVEMLSSVSSCAAVLNDQQLLLFCVPTDKHISPIPQCITHSHPFLSQVKDMVPSYGIPDAAFWVNSLPLTLHGKLDRERLCQIAKDTSCSMESLKSGNVKVTLLKLWQVELAHGLAIDDSNNFLQLGGDSFQAIQMASQMELLCKVPLPEFVDNLLHKCFSDVVVYVQDCLSKQEKYVEGNLSHTLRGGHPNQEASGIYDSTKQSKTSWNDILVLSQPDVVSHEACKFRCTCCYVAVRRGSQVTLCTQEVTRSSEVGDKPCTSAGSLWKPDAFQMRWKYNTGKCVDASPLLVRWRSKSVVFIGSHSHKFAAICMESGGALWESTLGDRVESSACLSTCGQFVVVGCYDHNVYFLDCNSGSVHWKYKTGGPVKSSPVADSDSSMVYIGSHDQYLHALCHMNKTCVWKIHCGGGSVFSSPVISYQTHCVYVGTLSGDLLAITKSTGKLQWKHKYPKPIFSSPAISKIGVVVGCADGILYCISYTGIMLWTFETQAPIFSSPCVFLSTPSDVMDSNLPALDDVIVFGSHDHYLYCVDNTTGTSLWKTKFDSQVYATPFIFQTERFPKRLKKQTSVDNENNERKRLNIIQKKYSSDDQPNRKYVRLENVTYQQVRSNSSISDDQGITQNEKLKGYSNQPVTECVLMSTKVRNTGTDSKSSQEHVRSTACDEESKHASSSDQKPTSQSQSSDVKEDSHLFVVAACTSGTVAILDISSGTVVASYELPGEVFSSPVVNGNQIVIGCRDDFVYCLDII